MIAGIISGSVSSALSIYQTFKSASDKKKIKEEWDNYELEEISNPYAGMDKAPTEAFNMRSDANATELATKASMASQSSRGLALLPEATDTYASRERELYGDLEKYEFERSKLVAGGEAEVQKLKVNQEQNYLAGLSSGFAAADASMNNALVSTGSSLASLGTEIDNHYAGKKPK